MGIRKPTLSVKEARTLASVRSTAYEELGAQNGTAQIPPVAAASAVGSANQSRKEPPQDRPAGKGENGARKTAQAQPTGAPLSKSAKASTEKAGPAAPIAEPWLQGSVLRRDKVQVFLSAPFPAAGVSPTFELLCKQYSPQKALQMILRKALHGYERLLANGSFQGVTQTYAVDVAAAAEAVQTSRMMPNRLVAIARAHFDPLELESTRAFGRKLGTAALAAFFANERAPR